MKKPSGEKGPNSASVQAIDTDVIGAEGGITKGRRSEEDGLLRFFRAMTVTLGVLGCWALTADGPAVPLVLAGILYLCFRMIVLAADPERRPMSPPGDASAAARPPSAADGRAVLPARSAGAEGEPSGRPCDAAFAAE